MVREQACKISHKWTQACDKQIARLTFYFSSHNTNFRQHCHVGNTAQHCRLGFFQDSYFVGDLEDSNSTSRGVLCALLEVEHFVPVSWMCKKQTSASHSSTESEVISLDVGQRIDGLPALDLWDLVIEVLRTTKDKPQPSHISHQETGALQLTSKHQETWSSSEIQHQDTTRHKNSEG